MLIYSDDDKKIVFSTKLRVRRVLRENFHCFIVSQQGGFIHGDKKVNGT